ncbi:MAG: hypothetical protein IJ565_05800 [Bacilli bacterium]|nr:hypothetical protein [Bacilli bacterium]
MNFRTHVNNIDFEMVLKILVTIIIVTYLIILGLGHFDVKNIIKQFSRFKGEIETYTIIEYLNNHSNYYYKIEGSTYCITKEDLVNSGEIPDNVINDMRDDIIEVNYQNGEFILKYNNECIEK